MIRVLVVDDSALVRKLFGAVLSREPDLQVRFARNGHEALDEVESFKPSVVTLDVQMPDMSGLECLDRIMVQRPCPVVMVSSITEAGAEETLKALDLGAIDFVAKPQGAVSLQMETFGPTLVRKVRDAAAAKLRGSLRLTDRVKHRIGRVASLQSRPSMRPAMGDHARASGDGLVVVGTSTGGPPALETLLGGLPEGFPWPVVIAQHMPEAFTGSLARRLDTLCAIRVVEVRQPVALTAGCAYIGRGEADVIVSRRRGELVAMAAPVKADYPWHPSTDRLVRTAMENVAASQLIGVLMTGMGNDGALAMTDLRARGGRTIAESEETAVVWGMPGELAKAGGATWVVPLPEIADRLVELVPADAAHP